jgi:hypothetical protein
MRRLTHGPRTLPLDPTEAVPASRQRDPCLDRVPATRTTEREPDRRRVWLVLGSPIPVDDIPVDLELELVLLVRERSAIGAAPVHYRRPDHATVMGTVRQRIPAEHADSFRGAPCNERKLVARRRRDLGQLSNDLRRRGGRRSGRLCDHIRHSGARDGHTPRLRPVRGRCSPAARHRREREEEDRVDPIWHHDSCLREPGRYLPRADPFREFASM